MSATTAEIWGAIPDFDRVPQRVRRQSAIHPKGSESVLVFKWNPPLTYARLKGMIEELSRWPAPCEDAFRYLAEHHSEKLLELIRADTLEPTRLTFAAEIVGSVAWSLESRTVLLNLLGHESPMVREGAIYGLGQHLDDRQVRESLERCKGSDPDRTIRQVIADVLS